MFSNLNFYNPPLDQWSLHHHIVDVFNSHIVNDLLQVQQNMYLSPIFKNILIDRNLKLNVKCSDFISWKSKERKFFYQIFCAFQHHIMNIFHHLPTQVIKPMLLGHVLDFEKVEQILKGLIVH